MSKKETAIERLERMKREKEAAKQEVGDKPSDLIGQLTHEDDGDPDFTELARKLAERKAREAKGENDGHVKMTIYVEKSLADSFNALITRRGQQKEFVNQALRDFVQKKAKELGID